MNFKSTIPEGTSGNWEVKKFIVSKEEANFHNLRCRIKGQRREIKTGQYTKLTRNEELIMSDTPAETEDFEWFVHEAKGKILINGLGLGCVVESLMNKNAVDYVTIIEISSDVIKLVGTFLQEKYPNRLEIIKANALSWIAPKGTKIYDYVWHDIWDNICGDNWEDMKYLHRKYAKKTIIQNSWCREEVRRLVIA